MVDKEIWFFLLVPNLIGVVLACSNHLVRTLTRNVFGVGMGMGALCSFIMCLGIIGYQFIGDNKPTYIQGFDCENIS